MSTGCNNHSCIGIVGCNLTIPCGDSITNTSTTTLVYSVLLLGSPTTTFYLSTFLIINITMLHVNGRVVCHVGNHPKGEYIINVTCKCSWSEGMSLISLL